MIEVSFRALTRAQRLAWTLLLLMCLALVSNEAYSHVDRRPKPHRDPITKSHRFPDFTQFIKEWKGPNTHIKNERHLVIADEKSWAKLWREHDPSVKRIPKVDFEKHMIIGMFNASYSKGNFRIEKVLPWGVSNGRNDARNHFKVYIIGSDKVKVGISFHMVLVESMRWPIHFYRRKEGGKACRIVVINSPHKTQVGHEKVYRFKGDALNKAAEYLFQRCIIKNFPTYKPALFVQNSRRQNGVWYFQFHGNFGLHSQREVAFQKDVAAVIAMDAKTGNILMCDLARFKQFSSEKIKKFFAKYPHGKKLKFDSQLSKKNSKP